MAPDRCEALEGDVTLSWLFYRENEGRGGVIILEASSTMEARLHAIQAGLETGVTFVRGHVLAAAMSVLVAPGEIGRLLPLDEAERIIERFEGGAPHPPLN
jgi:hypothetical protein